MVLKRIGLTEWVFINGKRFNARIDTGARRSSIDKTIAKRLELKEIKKVEVKSAHGRSLRPVVKARIRLSGTDSLASFTVADRRHMEFPVLIGRNVLKRGFLIDTKKS